MIVFIIDFIGIRWISCCFRLDNFGVKCILFSIVIGIVDIIYLVYKNMKINLKRIK